MLHVQLNMKPIKKITLQDVQDILAVLPTVTLLEALPVRYFDEGHLPGARQIPHDESLAQVAPRLIAHKAAPVIVYCASATCENSSEAAEQLLKLGYADISIFEGGKEEWRAAGLKLERSGSGGAA